METKTLHEHCQEKKNFEQLVKCYVIFIKFILVYKLCKVGAEQPVVLQGDAGVFKN